MSSERTQYGTRLWGGDVIYAQGPAALDIKIAKSNVIRAFSEVLVSRQVDKHGNPLTEWEEVK